MQSETPISIVQAWQDAANAWDVARLLELSAPDIEIIGPRGAGRGHQLLRDWLGRAGLHLTTLRTFARYDSSDEALAQAELGDTDEVKSG